MYVLALEWRDCERLFFCCLKRHMVLMAVTGLIFISLGSVTKVFCNSGASYLLQA